MYSHVLSICAVPSLHQVCGQEEKGTDSVSSAPILKATTLRGTAGSQGA